MRSCADALTDEAVTALVGSYVYYRTTADGFTLRAATKAEVDDHHSALRPKQTQTLQRDLTKTSITSAFQRELRRLDRVRRQGGQRGRVDEGVVISHRHGAGGLRGALLLLRRVHEAGNGRAKRRSWARRRPRTRRRLRYRPERHWLQR